MEREWARNPAAMHGVHGQLQRHWPFEEQSTPRASLTTISSSLHARCAGRALSLRTGRAAWRPSTATQSASAAWAMRKARPPSLRLPPSAAGQTWAAPRRWARNARRSSFSEQNLGRYMLSTSRWKSTSGLRCILQQRPERAHFGLMSNPHSKRYADISVCEENLLAWHITCMGMQTAGSRMWGCTAAHGCHVHGVKELSA